MTIIHRYYEEIMRNILKYVRSHPGCSVREIADELRMSWITANKYLEMLIKKKKVRFYSRGKVKRWMT